MLNQLHSDVLKFAEDYRSKNPGFRYALRKANRKNRLNDGLWFQGTEKYAFMGLINRSGGTNMTKSFGLVFWPKGDTMRCDLEIVSNEESDPNVLKFYKRLRDLIGGFENIHENKYRKTLSTENGFDAATKFLDNTKPKIDDLIKEMKLQSITIADDDFEEGLERIKEFESAALVNPNYWIFQGNPKVFDFEGAIKSGSIKSWTVTAHKDKIKPGDKIILWLTGPNAGCYALGEITSELTERKSNEDDQFFKTEFKSEWQVGIQITQNLFDNPILYKNIKDLQVFKNLKAGSQGTNFSSTQAEFEAFLNLSNGLTNHSRKYWLIAPGKQADMWEEFYNQGVMAIAWKTGDLNQYTTQEEVERILEKNSQIDKNQGINAQQCFEFAHEIKLDDIIIAKRGMSEYLGWGVVTEEYTYHPENDNFQHFIKVDWKTKGKWEGEIQQRKTLGNISDNPKLKSVIKLLKISSDGFDVFQKTKFTYDQSVFNTYIQVLRNILKSCNLGVDNNKIAFTISPPGRLNFIVGNRYYACVTKNKDQYIYYFTSSKELKTSTGPFSGEPLVYYNETENWKDLENNIDSISTALQSELGRLDISRQLKVDNKQFREFVFGINKTENSNIDMISYPLNSILYGPPGTGKTYESVIMAAAIIKNQPIKNYSEAKQIFHDNLHNRIEFITFHQNYSYEDFIQGLRPEVDNKATLTFNKVDGAFKKIADKALENYLLSEKDPEEISNESLFDVALESFKDEVEEAEPFFKINDATYIMEVEDDAFRYTGENWVQHANGIRMKFSDLKEFYRNHVASRKDIKKLKTISGLANQHATYYFLVYEKILKHLPKKSEALIKIERNNYVIVIDEINRANISRVFGELITLIEPDKRSHGDIPLEAKLPSGDTFTVPSNLYIIGTMNTADKSIALLDIALRRRFEFISMYPKYFVEGHEIYDVEILKNLNEQIIGSKGHDFQIGHSYFMKENKDLVQRMNNKVIPLLLEYYMNDEKEVKNILYKAGLELEPDSWPIRILGKRG